MGFLPSLITLKDAARIEGKRVSFIRELVDSGRLPAYRDGGSDKAPRLKVKPDELAAAIRAATLYVPPTSPANPIRRAPSRRQPGQLHPRVRF